MTSRAMPSMARPLGSRAADSVAAVAPILDHDQRPAWIGPPVYTVPRTADETTSATDGQLSVGLYPICLEPTDTRCAPSASTASQS